MSSADIFPSYCVSFSLRIPRPAIFPAAMCGLATEEPRSAVTRLKLVGARAVVSYFFFFSLATSRAIQEISIVYALAAVVISAVFISLVGSEVR